jgi:hypothetical protein
LDTSGLDAGPDGDQAKPGVSKWAAPRPVLSQTSETVPSGFRAPFACGVLVVV